MNRKLTADVKKIVFDQIHEKVKSTAAVVESEKKHQAAVQIYNDFLRDKGITAIKEAYQKKLDEIGVTDIKIIDNESERIIRYRSEGYYQYGFGPRGTERPCNKEHFGQNTIDIIEKITNDYFARFILEYESEGTLDLDSFLATIK